MIRLRAHRRQQDLALEGVGRWVVDLLDGHGRGSADQPEQRLWYWGKLANREVDEEKQGRKVSLARSGGRVVVEAE